MRRQDKKGQAAMEFLMTYGWAILAAIIAIGVLAYFGVFSPGRFVQDSVFISAPLGASSAQALANGTVSIEVQNGAGDAINITNFSIAVTSPSGVSCNSTTGIPIINAGASAIVPVSCNPVAADTRLRGEITARYNVGSAAFDSTSTGSITATVQ